jgi:peptidoglycan L-alanyl-D-glutamate endopeptidase CwlK
MELLLVLGIAGYFVWKNSQEIAPNLPPISQPANQPANQPVNNWLTQNNETKLNQVQPALATKIKQLISIANNQGYLIYIDEAYRTQARQNQLYAQGRTTAGAIVTNTLNSKHTQGKAVDLMPVINGQPTNNLNAFNWQLIGIWARQVGGLTWGGNWSLRDYRHLEI